MRIALTIAERAKAAAQASLLAGSGAMVKYTYRVVRPMTAILTKRAQSPDHLTEAISLHVRLPDEEHAYAWIEPAIRRDNTPDEGLRAFQDRIFLQDRLILESQRPKRVPLAAGVEVPQRADRLSAAYRHMLKRVGLRYGVL